MLRTQVVNAVTNERATVEFFPDDTIETIRQRIGVVTDTHPDKLFVLIQRSRSKDFYTSDPRNWEALFLRLSYTSKTLLREPFELYQSRYRTPATALPYEPVGKDEWMAVPSAYASLYDPGTEFREYTVFGVAEHRSYVLPFAYSNAPNLSSIPVAEYPIPEQLTLFQTLYGGETPAEFVYVVHEGAIDATVYFPFLRPTTPPRLSVEAIQALQTATRRLQRLQALNAPLPTDISLTRVRFRIPWVDTDFGDAVRTRFEQILYGQTVSKAVPYIGLFTGSDEVTRHKFFTNDPKSKTPALNVTTWKAWYNVTKPYRNRPTLLLYRGKSHHSFDRIAITSVDMIVSAYRSEKEMDPFQSLDALLEEVRSSLAEWVSQLDAVLPFVDARDLQRWELEDTSAVLKYSKKLEDYDLRRFPVFANVFDVADRGTATFRFLRADVPVGSADAKLIQLLRQRPDISVTELQDELDLPVEQAQLIRDDPGKAFKAFPTMRMGTNTTLVSSTKHLGHAVLYANLLRYVLGTDNEEVASVGGRRMERVSRTVGMPMLGGGGDEEDDEYADLWDEAPSAEEEVKTVPLAAEEPAVADAYEDKLKTYRKGKRLHNYFTERLREFDPATFSSEKSEYPKKCEQDHQPIVLTQSALDAMDPTYDPRTWEAARRLEIEGVDGTKGYVICPEYWCLYDEIPLMESQLVDQSDGFLRCPVCKGKVQSGKDDDVREFPVLARDKTRAYPGFISKYKSPSNGKPLPCCYKIAESGADKAVMEDKYYILGETKDHIPAKRIAFMPRAILQSLHIPYEYDKLQGKKRILDGDRGVFRVGLGPQPSKVLPELLGIERAIPRPRDVPERALKCSFVPTWTRVSDEPIETRAAMAPQLKRIVAGMDDAFMRGEFTPIQDLEYACIMLDCDVFRLRMDTQSVECMFFNRAIYDRNRAIVVLQVSPDDTSLDALCHVTRKAKGFQFQASLYSRKSRAGEAEYTTPFKKETAVELETLRNAACAGPIPSFKEAVLALRDIMIELSESVASIVLDPYGRAQAMYIPDKVLLPFSPVPLPIVDMPWPTVPGLDVVRPPTYDQARAYLEIAKRHSAGFEWKEDVTNASRERVELILASGLRVPVQPQKADRLNLLEVTDTIRDVGEDELVFGEPDPDVRTNYEDISYSSEVFDFLMFTLSKELKSKYPELKRALQTPTPVRSAVEGPLRAWFEEQVHTSHLDRPEAFLSKVRTPCGQFTSKDTCKGNVCGWNGSVCRIEVRKSVNREKLFARLLSTLVSNAKLRGVVLDGRSTPFFSTILYLELPHELIITDTEVPQYQ